MKLMIFRLVWLALGLAGLAYSPALLAVTTADCPTSTAFGPAIAVNKAVAKGQTLGVIGGLSEQDLDHNGLPEGQHG